MNAAWSSLIIGMLAGCQCGAPSDEPDGGSRGVAADAGGLDAGASDAGRPRKDCFAPDAGGTYFIFPIKDLPFGCTHFKGNLGSGNMDLASLNAGTIVEIDGDLTIQNGDRPLDLQGLESLERIRGRLFLSSLPLTSTSAMAKLKQVGSLQLLINYQLEDIDLPALELIERDFSVLDHDRLRTLAGLQRLRAVGGEFWVRSNPRLPRLEIDRFTSRVFIDGGVKIQ
ncbi:MAG: hypothetical protein ABTQ32_15780 [Myxococcaceae bacterium]